MKSTVSAVGVVVVIVAIGGGGGGDYPFSLLPISHPKTPLIRIVLGGMEL